MRITRLALAGLVGVLAWSGAATGGEAPNVVGKRVGSEVADIQINGWLGNTDGRTTIADHKGEVVMVELWATT